MQHISGVERQLDQHAMQMHMDTHSKSTRGLLRLEIYGRGSYGVLSRCLREDTSRDVHCSRTKRMLLRSLIAVFWPEAQDFGSLRPGVLE